MITAFVMLGNSDDKLSQDRWASFVRCARDRLRRHAREIHGEWYSAPDSDYQNACFCVVIPEDSAGLVKMELSTLREDYQQDSIAWSEAPVTEFI